MASDISPTGAEVGQWVRDFIREGATLADDTPDNPFRVIRAHEDLADSNVGDLPPRPEGEYATFQISRLQSTGTASFEYDSKNEVNYVTQNLKGMVRVDFIGEQALSRTIRFITWATSRLGVEAALKGERDFQFTFFEQLQETDDLWSRTWQEIYDVIFEIQLECTLNTQVRRSDQVSDPLGAGGRDISVTIEPTE